MRCWWQGQNRSGLVSRHEVSGRGRGGRLVRVLRDCIRATVVAVWLPAAVVLVWCAMVAGPDVLAVAQTSARAQEPSDLGTRAGRAAAAVEDEGEGQGVSDTALDGKPGVPRVSGNESFLAWMARASGPIGLVIAAMSFYLFALVVWMALRYRTSIAIPGPLVRKLHVGLPMAQRAMELANEDATMEMEHRTTYLATVGTLGPMIGLVGTV